MNEKKKLQRLLGDYDETLSWFVADDYEIKDDEIVVKEKGAYRGYSPMNEPELFWSFARLGSYTNLSDYKILRWVRKYGLLKRQFPEKTPTKYADLQAPMKVIDFTIEAREAYSASLLYYDLKWGGQQSLKNRLREARDYQSRGRLLTELEKKLIDLWKDRLDKPSPKSKGLLEYRTQLVLQSFLTRKLSGVRLCFSTPDEQYGSLWSSTEPAYHPRASWRCPDLLSVMYLHFYLVVTEAQPIRLCDNHNCRVPFPVTRKDKKFCSEGCRSSGRASRRR